MKNKSLSFPALMLALAASALFVIGQPHQSPHRALHGHYGLMRGVGIVWQRESGTLPASVIVSGAGTGADNGTYTLSTGNDSSGNKYYQVGASSLYVYWVSPSWCVGPVLDSGSPHYYNTGASSYAAGPVGLTYATYNGAAPAPTVAAGSSAPTRRRVRSDWG